MFNKRVQSFYAFEYSSFSFTDNYVLSGYTAGSYVLFSSPQREHGPRLYDPFFGFAYMGKNSQIRVVLLKGSAIVEDLTPTPSLSVSDLSWKYFSRNLTTLTNSPFLWPMYTVWQVKLHFCESTQSCLKS